MADGEIAEHGHRISGRAGVSKSVQRALIAQQRIARAVLAEQDIADVAIQAGETEHIALRQEDLLGANRPLVGLFIAAEIGERLQSARQCTADFRRRALLFEQERGFFVAPDRGVVIPFEVQDVSLGAGRERRRDGIAAHFSKFLAGIGQTGRGGKIGIEARQKAGVDLLHGVARKRRGGLPQEQSSFLARFERCELFKPVRQTSKLHLQKYCLQFCETPAANEPYRPLSQPQFARDRSIRARRMFEK